MFRCRPLLDLAQMLPCTLRLQGCIGRDCVPAHSNWMSEGKGRGIKAHDCYFASACPVCHHLIDNDKKLSDGERRDAWIRGFLETTLLLWQHGLIAVADAPRAVVALPGRMKFKQKFSGSTARPQKILGRGL